MTSSGPGRMGRADVVAGGRRPVSGLDRLGRKQACLSQATAQGQVRCQRVTDFVGPAVCGSVRSLQMARSRPCWTHRIHKTREHCEDICNRGYILWRLHSQFMEVRTLVLV